MMGSHDHVIMTNSFHGYYGVWDIICRGWGFVCCNRGVRYSTSAPFLQCAIIANIDVLPCGGSFVFVSDQVSKHLQTVQAIHAMKRQPCPSYLD